MRNVRVASTVLVAGCMIFILILSAILFQRRSQIEQAKANLLGQSKIVADFIMPLWGDGNSSDFVRALGSVSKQLQPDYLIVSDENGLIRFSYPRIDLLHSQLPDNWSPSLNSISHNERTLGETSYFESVQQIRLGDDTTGKAVGHVILGIEQSRITRPINEQLALFSGLLALLLVIFTSWFVIKKATYDNAFARFKEQISQIAAGRPLVLETHRNDPNSWQRLLDDTNIILSKFYDTEKHLIEAEKSSAVAKTTQMLAHDVRKPFSMFKSIIQIVEGTEDLSEVREVLRLTLPEVNQAMASVEGMISDVMQIGTEAQVQVEDAPPEALIEAALGELFRIYPNALIAISYEMSHRHMTIADPLRIGRVFANILGNAVQAMGEKGDLWIRTTEREGLVEFTLGNGGSLIPASSLPKLFDAFFTSGKRGGTGLGLAIAKKIVEAHGGTIWCTSEQTEDHPTGMVEFSFTLPTSKSLCERRSEPLPSSSREIQAAILAARITGSRQESAKTDPRELELETAILERISKIFPRESDKVTVLAVEDEGVYRTGLIALVERYPALSARVRMVFAQNDDEALTALNEYRPVLVIEDVDLGPLSKNGIEIVRIFRERGFKGHICVHSNRFLPEDNRAAMTAGADSVLPKPLGRAHFLKLLLASLPSETAASPLPETKAPKLSVAVLDDSISMRMAWKMELKDNTQFRAFASTDAFLELCDTEPLYLSTLEVVISDYNFAPGDPHNGGTLACALRARGYRGLIFKASGETDLGADIEAHFDGDVGKSALEWPEFRAIVESSQKNRRLA